MLNNKNLNNRNDQLTKLIEPSRKQQKGFALLDLLIVVIIIGIISSISLLNLLSSKRSANAAATVQAMRTISTSQSNYFSTTGNGEYATPSDLFREQFIDSSLAGASIPTPANVNQSPKSGYIFFFDVRSASEVNNTTANYSISARPLFGASVSRGGDRSYFVDGSGVIRFNESPLAPFADENSSPLNR
jgi:type II secretory pathway pseudopilin PulG